MSATPARRAALRVLRSVRDGELADRALGHELEGLPARERAWVTELCQGTMRLRGRLDHALRRAVRRPLESLDADVLDVLRLGAYQLTEMRSVPAYAAVSQSVELARQSGRAARLVNAALHAFQRAGTARYPDFDSDPIGYLSTWGSHPGWLVERWFDRWGSQSTRELTESNNTRPILYVRAVGQSRESALKQLVACGVACSPVAAAPDAIRLEPGTNIDAALAAVPLIVQDPAAGLVARFVAPPPGALVADLCAAPGGKAIALADSRGTSPASRVRVLAGDLSVRRLGRLIDNVGRLPQLPISILVADGRKPPIRTADAVLIDAPCTGTGTFRRHPDGRWRIGPDDLAALVRLQAELLDAAAAIVTGHGVLVYATCSLEEEENERQIDAFLDRHPEFTVEPPPEAREEWLDGAGRLCLLPHVHGFDGAFAARLRRSD